ncbi:hypothetical protein B0H16DRAFT_1687286 [Mycena metata]|uniref:Uncharacterized protein n=1 Tax=Mycena metata TaxID=1033252 RepID=A0AAD7JIN2_9AGAR|nr:hypothetical protein B0H16DRAFT_1687286 [Mycena metata]
MPLAPRFTHLIMVLVYADDESSRELAGLGPRFSFAGCPHSQGFVCTNTHENDDTDKNNENENGDENLHEKHYENPINDSDSDYHSAAVSVYPSPPPTASTPKRSVPLPGPASSSSSGSCSKQNAQDYHFGGILDSPVVLMKRACSCGPSGSAGAWAPLPSIVGPGLHNVFPPSPPPTTFTPTHALPPASPRPSSSLLLPIPEDDQSSDDYGGGDERRSAALQLLSPLSPEWPSNRQTPEAGDGGNVPLDERGGEMGDSVLMAPDAEDDEDEDADAGSDILAGRGGFGRPSLHPLDIPMSTTMPMFPLGKASGPDEDVDGAHLLLGFASHRVPHLQLQGEDATMHIQMQVPLSPASLRSTTSFGSMSPTSASSSGSFSSFDSPSSASEMELDDLDMEDLDPSGAVPQSSPLSVPAWGPPSPPSSLYPTSPYTFGYGIPLAGPSSYHSPALRALPLLSPPPKASFFHENDGAKCEEEELDELDLDMELGLGFGMSSSPSPSRRAVARLPELEDVDPPFFDHNRGSAFAETEALGESDVEVEGRSRMMEDADATVQLEPPDPPHGSSLWGEDADLPASTAGDTDGGNALHLSLPLSSASDLANKAFTPPPSILDGYTPTELAMRLPFPDGDADADAETPAHKRMREELEGLLAVRARARVALAACQQSTSSSSTSSTPSSPSSSASASPTASPSASPSPEPPENRSGSGSPGTTPTVLDHELRRTVPRDAGEPRRRRKRAKELGREIDALVGLRLGLLPPPVVAPAPVVAPVSIFAAPAASPSGSSGEMDVEQQTLNTLTQKLPQPPKPHNIRRDKAGLAGLASVPQLVARMILRRRERCVRGLDGGASKAGRGRGASPLRVGAVFGEDGDGEDEAQDAEMDVDVDV